MGEESFIKFENSVDLASIRSEITKSPSYPEASSTEGGFTGRYGPLIPISVTPPRKRQRIELFDGYSPIMDALYQDAIDNIEGYDVSDVDTTLIPALDIASVDVHQLDNFLKCNKEVFLPNGQPAIGIEHSI